MDPDELNRKVDELVQYLLVMDQKKLPIKKLDINKTVLKEHSKAHGAILKRAAAQLSGVFGIEVVELQDKLKGTYILINKLDTANHLAETWSEVDDAKTGLLMMVLSIVFMSGNVVQDGDLWHSLRSLGIDSDMPHETFGDVKKLVMQEFTRQAYLECSRLQNSEQPIFEVRWGQRAKLETCKKKVLKFVCLLYDMEPEQWAAQFQDMTDEEQASVSAS